MDDKRGLVVFKIILCVIFLLLSGRLFQLQIIEGKENMFLADSNRAKRLLLKAPRGIIVDRHGQNLVQNSPLFFVKEEDGEDKEISRDEALILQAEEKPVRITTRRHYLDDDLFAHLLGYLGEVNEKELTEEKLDLRGYSIGSLIGRTGVEAQYEDLLKGKDGSELVEINTAGKIVRRIDKVLPESGKTLTLTVDKKLQQAAKEEMKNLKGAVVASNPKNGEILVFYSSPSYDLNILNDKGRNSELVKLIKDDEHIPLLNRIIAGLYQPGSTFKIITPIAGLEEGKITESTQINDPGVIEVNGFKFANWFFTQHGGTEREVNVVKALARSVDTFYYKLGESLGIDRLAKWAEKFGVDSKYGIDLPGELSGFVGTPEWKTKNRNEGWFLGNTYHMAIGQGDLALTPMGVNFMTGVVANGGKICKPRVLKIGAENTPYQPECREIGIKEENLQLVKNGMIAACSQGGTAYPFFTFDPKVACKTGTAEIGDDGKLTHAWFTVFAPIENPQIVLTVLVERGGEGSSTAAPIAKKILEEYFR